MKKMDSEFDDEDQAKGIPINKADVIKEKVETSQ